MWINLHHTALIDNHLSDILVTLAKDCHANQQEAEDYVRHRLVALADERTWPL